MLDVAAVALVLPFPMADKNWTQSLISFLAGLHDIGKADFAFQSQAPHLFQKLAAEKGWSTGDPPCRHERLSAQYLKEWLREKDTDIYTADALSKSLLSHHGYWDTQTRPVGNRYAAAQNELSAMLHNLLGSPGIPLEKPDNLSAVGICLSGHIVLSDWIASNDQFFTDPGLQNIEFPQQYFEASQALAKEWIVKLSLVRSAKRGRPKKVVAVPRPLQNLLLNKNIPPSLVIIEAPMGEGKTEAAWILAEKWKDEGHSGMYMALPTMATSDSLHGRYRDDYLGSLYADRDVKLIHGMAWLRDELELQKPLETGEKGDDTSFSEAWFRPTRRAMLSEHGVGTIDQAMLAAMNAKFGFLRLYGLTGKVLVIDEVHAYDSYMNAIIARLLQWCSGLKIPVILLSATLSSGQRQELIEAYGAELGSEEKESAYPLVTVAEAKQPARFFTTAASMTKKLNISLLPGFLGNHEKTAEKAKKLANEGGCCCVILNTVRQAQAVYSALDMPPGEKMLFHARFKAADRQRITERVLELFGKDTSKRPEKFVLVATQVVEQSLDVDFDHMLTEIAPVDLLLQRSGRLHRHRKRRSDPTLHILTPELKTDAAPSFGGTGYVYAGKPLFRTLALLSTIGEFNLPDDFRMAIERCYGTEKWEQGKIAWDLIEKADHEWELESQKLKIEGEKFALKPPNARFYDPVENNPVGDDSDEGSGWRARTRLGANDRTVFFADKEEINGLIKGELSMSAVREIYRHTVKLPSYLPLFSPAPGFNAAVEATGKLKGLQILPLGPDGKWSGEEKGKIFQISYDKNLGLLAGRVE